MTRSSFEHSDVFGRLWTQVDVRPGRSDAAAIPMQVEHGPHHLAQGPSRPVLLKQLAVGGVHRRNPFAKGVNCIALRHAPQDLRRDSLHPGQRILHPMGDLGVQHFLLPVGKVALMQSLSQVELPHDLSCQHHQRIALKQGELTLLAVKDTQGPNRMAIVSSEHDAGGMASLIFTMKMSLVPQFPLPARFQTAANGATRKARDP